jgi:hypothetical protein
MRICRPLSRRSSRSLYFDERVFTVSNPDSAASGAYNPQVSGDGQTVGLTRNGNAELLGVGVNVPGPGLLTLSRNARWAVLTVTTIMPPPINSYPGPYPGPITGGFCTYSGSGRNGGFTWNAPAPATP